ncbi:MAG: hypothetical protein KF866_02430 [Phycisphaeraceae bacterium]|nr:hypothetical protein [Phycisphaeraceae bacterium]MCW5753449.1 hypothetical protein [Phycisphaeraceae bacterium]
MKVLIADKFESEGIAGLERLGCVIADEPGIGTAGLAEALARTGADVLIVRSTKVPADVISAATKLKLIVRAGAGYDTIDIKAAGAAGIGVCNCPGTNSVAVAELTMALLLECDRRVADQTADLRAGVWKKKEYGKARGLKGLRLGVVGLGSIGKAVIQRAQAFEMKVAAWSANMTPARAAELGVENAGKTREDLLRLARSSDAVTAHVAATEATRRMFDGAFFAEMRPGSYFINTTRGSVVDEAALRMAVQKKGIRCGLDVFEDEPAADGPWKSPTALLPGVYGSHHVGASTDQAQRAVAEVVVQVVQTFKDTGRFEHCVNAQEIMHRPK